MELLTTAHNDPRVLALHHAKDAELLPKYEAYAREHGIPNTVENPLDPADILLTVLIEVDGQPAGTGMLRRNGDKLELKRIMVSPNFRGMGLAKTLLERLESEALHHGATTAWLHTGILQPDAIALYEKRGWQKLDYVFEPYADDGLSVCFTKQLVAPLSDD